MAAVVESADLPVIDYPLLSSKESDRSLESAKERKYLYQSLQKLGFVYLRNPGVTQRDVDRLFFHARTFFAKPDSEKAQILGKMDKGRGPSQGYSNPHKLAANPDTSDIKEFFGIYRDDDAKRPNQWLKDTDSRAMRAALVSFFDSCQNVILELLSVLAESIGLETQALWPMVEERNHFIACLHYPSTSIESFKTRVRAAAHSDYGCMTLLFNDEGEGLQVMGPNEEYQYIARKNDCAIVNVGDLLSRLFNGTLPSTMHRVIEPPSAEGVVPDRYSIAFFAHLNADLLIRPLDPCVSDSKPAQFEPLVAGEHVKARVKQLHAAGHSTRREAAVNR